MNQGPWWDAGDTIGWGKPQGELKLGQPEILAHGRLLHATLKEQVGHHNHAIAICRVSTPQDRQGTTPQNSQATDRQPARLLPPDPPGHPPAEPSDYCLPTNLPGCCPPTSSLANQLLPTTRGLQPHQMPAPNLPRRRRQTGLDAKGVTPELLRLKF
jgi:hypothetical protein